MSDRTFGHKKANTSTFSNPSLVSPTTPTLANPVRGFGLPTNNVIQTATEESTNLQEAQAADEQSLLSEVIYQRSFGHDISRMALRRPQAKLTVGAPNDVHEQEADRVADQVMSMPDAKPSVQREVMPEEEEEIQTKTLGNSIQREAMPEEEEEIQTKPLAATITPLVQREAMPEEEEELQTKALGDSIQREAMSEEEEEIQTKRSADTGFQGGSNLENRLSSSQGGGSPLPGEVRSFMEPRFVADFSQVRVHTDSNAVQMNRQLNAQALAHGNDIYFGAGKSLGNNQLTAHELTHVVQQVGKIQAKIDGSSGNPVDPPQSKDDKPQVPPTDLAEPPKTVPSNTPLPQQPDLVVPQADKSIDLPATAGNGKDSPTLSAPPSTTASNVALPQEPQPNILGGSVAEKPVQSQNIDATASPAIKAPDVPDLSQSTLPDATGTPPTLPESPILAATAQQILQTAEIEKTAFSQQVQSHRSSLQKDSIATAQNIESTTQSKIQATLAAIGSRKAEVLSRFVSTRASITTEMDSQKAVAHADGEKALEALRKQGEDKRQAAVKAAEEPASQAEKNGEIEAERVRKSSSETIGRINAIAQQKAQGQGSTPEERKAAREATMSAAAEVVNKIRSNAEELVQGAIQAAQKTAQTLRGEGKKLADSLGGSTTQVEQSIQQGVTSTINAIQTAGNQRLQSLDTLQAQALASLEQLKGQVIPALQQSGQQAQQAAQQLGQMMVGQLDVAEAQSLQQFDQGVTGAIDQLHQADGQPHLDRAALQGAGQQVSEPFRQGRLQLEAILGEQVAEMGGQLGKLETSFATEIEAASQKFQTSTNQVLSSTNSGLSQMQSDTTKLFTDTLATGRDAAQQAVQQYGDGLQQKIDETKQGWNKAKDQSQTDIRTQVDKGLSSHAEMETKAPGDFEKAAKHAVDDAQGSIWSGIGKGLLSVLKGLAIFAIVVVGIAAIIAVAFGVAFGWPLILAVAAVVGIIFLVYAFGSRLVVRYNELVSVLPKDTPWYAQFLLGMALPFIALGDVIGVVPIYEGIIGENAITGKKFTKEERAEKITEGVLTLVLIFLTERFAKGAGKTGEPAIDPSIKPPTPEPPAPKLEPEPPAPKLEPEPPAPKLEPEPPAPKLEPEPPAPKPEPKPPNFLVEAEAEAKPLVKPQTAKALKRFDMSNDPAANDTVAKTWKDTFTDEFVRQRQDGADTKTARKAAQKLADSEANKVAISRASDAARQRAKTDLESGDAFKRDPNTEVVRNEYDQGTRGGNAKSLSPRLAGRTVAEMIEILDADAAAGRCDKSTTNLPMGKGQPPKPQVSYQYPDGTLVRVKPNGDAFGNDPKYSVEVTNTTQPATGQEDIAFKVSTDGKPVPKGPNDINNPYNKATNSEQFTAYQDVVLEAGHLTAQPNLPPTPPPSP
ncbi:MAG: DUF4157 domain-containing protein [Nostoc sp.]|uniref:eCIS core domain-containing protein n=1 Tax=Nostoc sp. TaxID=1180 RepID=UPI002FF87248